METNQPSLFGEADHLEVAHAMSSHEEPAHEPAQESLNALYQSFLDTQRAMQAILDKHRALEKKLLPNISRSFVIDTGINQYAKNAADALFYHAIDKYSVNGDRLAINKLDELTEIKMDALYYDEIHGRHRLRDNPIHVDKDTPIDLDLIANHLYQKYGGEAGLHATYRQQARNLDNVFKFQKQEMKMTGRGVVLRISTFLEVSKFCTKKYSVYHSMSRNWSEVILALKIFSDFITMPELKDDLDKLKSYVCCGESYVTVPTWETKYFHLRPFAAGHAQLTIHSDVARKLQHFLGLYLEPQS